MPTFTENDPIRAQFQLLPQGRRRTQVYAVGWYATDAVGQVHAWPVQDVVTIDPNTDGYLYDETRYLREGTYASMAAYQLASGVWVQGDVVNVTVIRPRSGQRLTGALLELARDVYRFRNWRDSYGFDLLSEDEKLGLAESGIAYDQQGYDFRRGPSANVYNRHLPGFVPPPDAVE